MLVLNKISTLEWLGLNGNGPNWQEVSSREVCGVSFDKLLSEASGAFVLYGISLVHLAFVHAQSHHPL